MQKFSLEEKKRLLDFYFSKFYSSYSREEIDKITKEFGISYSEKMMEIYSALNILSPTENPYIGFVNLIEEQIGIDKNILEVGGGIYPSLANIISKRQLNIGKGKITVYDPLLGLDNLNSIKLIKEPFRFNTDISKYDLIIGKEPCGATYSLIENSKSNNKEFIMSPCNCYTLLPEYIEYEKDSLKQWYEFVYELCIPSNNDFKLSKHELNESYNYKNPIFVYKKNK